MKTRTKVNEKEKPAKTTAKKDFHQPDKIQLLRNLILHLPLLLVFSEAPNGLRYQRVGELGGGLRCGKNSKPEKYSKVGETPRASGARFVRPHDWQKKEPDEKM